MIDFTQAGSLTADKKFNELRTLVRSCIETLPSQGSSKTTPNTLVFRIVLFLLLALTEGLTNNQENANDSLKQALELLRFNDKDDFLVSLMSCIAYSRYVALLEDQRRATEPTASSSLVSLESGRQQTPQMLNVHLSQPGSEQHQAYSSWPLGVLYLLATVLIDFALIENDSLEALSVSELFVNFLLKAYVIQSIAQHNPSKATDMGLQAYSRRLLQLDTQGDLLVPLNMMLLRAIELYGLNKDYEGGIQLTLEVVECCLFKKLECEWVTCESLTSYINHIAADGELTDCSVSVLVLLVTSGCNIVVYLVLLGGDEYRHQARDLLQALIQLTATRRPASMDWITPRLVASIASTITVLESYKFSVEHANLPSRSIGSSTSEAFNSIHLNMLKLLSVRISISAEVNGRSVNLFYKHQYKNSFGLLFDSLPAALRGPIIGQYLFPNGAAGVGHILMLNIYGSFCVETSSIDHMTVTVNAIRNFFILFEFAPNQQAFIDEFCDSLVDFGISDSQILYGMIKFK